MFIDLLVHHQVDKHIHIQYTDIIRTGKDNEWIVERTSLALIVVLSESK